MLLRGKLFIDVCLSGVRYDDAPRSPSAAAAA